MKKLLKSIIAAMLVAIIAISALGTETAQAASNPVIKVTYNKKTVKFTLTDTGVKKVSYKTLKKNWGKPTRTDKDEQYGQYAQYTWEKGKSTFTFTEHYDNPARDNYNIMICDKKTTVCGIKIGMKADKAEKILKKIGGTFEKLENYMYTTYNNGLVKIDCNINNGKISGINVTIYVGE